MTCVHAFIDESARRNVYILAAAVVNPGDLAKARRAMRGLLVPGAREVHFAKREIHDDGRWLIL